MKVIIMTFFLSTLVYGIEGVKDLIPLSDTYYVDNVFYSIYDDALIDGSLLRQGSHEESFLLDIKQGKVEKIVVYEERIPVAYVQVKDDLLNGQVEFRDDREYLRVDFEAGFAHGKSKGEDFRDNSQIELKYQYGFLHGLVERDGNKEYFSIGKKVDSIEGLADMPNYIKILEEAIELDELEREGRVAYSKTGDRYHGYSYIERQNSYGVNDSLIIYFFEEGQLKESISFDKESIKNIISVNNNELIYDLAYYYTPSYRYEYKEDRVSIYTYRHGRLDMYRDNFKDGNGTDWRYAE